MPLVGRRHFTPASAGGAGPAPGEATTPPRFLGAASCAAAACHAGGSTGARRSEYTTWSAQDKHARAYQVLFQPRAILMATRLGLGKAHAEKLCLNCHVRPDYDEKRDDVWFAKGDGVSCESCHGPAERWVAEHHRDGWAGKSAAEKRALGFADTRSLLARARTCVPCHVGAPGGDVNHDLIAAGHPRLAFEFGAYHANMPRHWSRAEDSTRYRDLEVRAWRVGQAVSAEAAVALLRSRAESAKAPWPEFAAYDCAACHHDLQSPSWRQKLGDTRRAPGSLRWGTWYVALLPEVTGAPTEAGIVRLRKLLEKPLPSRSEVAAETKALLGTLRAAGQKLAEQPSAEPEGLLGQFDAIARTGEKLSSASWDEAVQVYLALAAHQQTLSDLKDPALPREWRPQLRSLAKLLEFPPGFDSPRGFEPAAVRARLRTLMRVGHR
jgi:hypothetical protein